MDLNNIQLSDKVFAELYKDSIVEVNTAEPAGTAMVQKQWKWLGENRKNVLVVVDYPDVVHIPDKQLIFLTNLLSACKLSLGDVSVLNFHHFNAADFNDIISRFKSKVVFLFGVEPADFGMPVLFPQFQVQAFKNASFLFAPSLHDTEPDRILKSKLWVCLKMIFNL